ncbi:MAG TPA: hybrid sensor histidine kinase/response regulator, partial [Polyangia bacterium]|nr:hybrid sensor histidine kinase/response regulator [Polyangia bacterium]
MAQSTLEDEGHEVVLAEDGEKAVALFSRRTPDCVLLDVKMPKMDGVEACRQIRALPGGAEVPIVFLTALRDLDTFDRVQFAGGDDFMTKPYRPNELVVRVEAALRLRRISAERNELYALLKHQRDDLQRLQLQKEQLAAFLVHDLKNPVNSINLQAELIRRDASATDRTRRAASRIADETNALMRMITNLMDISKADEGKLAPHWDDVDVAALGAEVVDHLRARAEGAGVSLVADVTAVSARADRDLLRRVLENLIDNAIRHAPEGTAVRLQAANAAEATTFRVADAGQGVPPSEREQVFERFVQSADQSRASHSNRGLGLAF